TKTVDPLGGSYYVESLTCDIEKGILEELKKVEEMGGALAAIEKGYHQSVITKGAVKRQQEFEQKHRISVGVNKFRSKADLPLGAFRVNPKVEETQLLRLRDIKKSRNNDVVKAKLEDIQEKALSKINLVEPILEAVRAYATIGEICQVLRDVYGEHQVIGQF
ncbi:MAG: methylmalonyl-CoA mutase, partial [Syntrophomonadaceae bacterium]|nr:methylmalonyl-CoA mutase [Syntrophomonadaceae bacterium]